MKYTSTYRKFSECNELIVLVKMHGLALPFFKLEFILTCPMNVLLFGTEVSAGNLRHLIRK
jgi:hypothetical protein